MATYVGLSGTPTAEDLILSVEPRPVDELNAQVYERDSDVLHTVLHRSLPAGTADRLLRRLLASRLAYDIRPASVAACTAMIEILDRSIGDRARAT